MRPEIYDVVLLSVKVTFIVLADKHFIYREAQHQKKSQDAATFKKSQLRFMQGKFMIFLFLNNDYALKIKPYS